MSILDAQALRDQDFRARTETPPSPASNPDSENLPSPSENCYNFLTPYMPTSPSTIAAAIRNRVAAPRKIRVWTPEDFDDLGPRTAVDQALHRLVAAGKLR